MEIRLPNVGFIFVNTILYYYKVIIPVSLLSQYPCYPSIIPYYSSETSSKEIQWHSDFQLT